MSIAIPNEEHFAIVIEETTYHEGDERSRTHPGHGYPAHSTSDLVYKAYTDKGEWENQIRQLAFRRASFRALIVKPVEFSVEVVVTSVASATSNE